MKKIVCIILCISIALVLCSCNIGPGPNPDPNHWIPTLTPPPPLTPTPTLPPPPPPPPGAEELKYNQLVTVGDAVEFTIESSEWTDKILPSDTSSGYSYVNDKANEKYFVAKGKVKNLSSEELDVSFYGMDASVLINDKYKADVQIEAEDTDGRGFYGKIKPLQTLNVIFYASISDELYKICNNVDMTLKVVNDARYLSEFFNEDKVPYNTYLYKFTN